jgi:ADP-ribosylglycohydrolase
MNDLRRRARNALLGLAIGDAIGWPAMFHRSRLLPPWTRRIRREMDAQREDAGVLRVPMPFSLNQPFTAFDLCPTDDTEWAAWTIDGLLAHRLFVNADWVTQRWSDLAHGGTAVRGGVSTQATLANLRNGVMPPASGRNNPHYFDDGAACRAVPIGIAYAGSPDRAAAAAAIDACVTNAEDGIWIAQSMAAAVSAACGGGSRVSVIEIAVGFLPADSWSRRTVDRALRLSEQDVPLLALLPLLQRILNAEYSDGCVGPETLAITLAIIQRFGDRFDEAVTTAAAFAKGADALPALVGAIAGALAPGTPIPPEWEGSLGSLRGICLPSLAGRDYQGLVETFVSACSSSEDIEEHR